MPHSILRRKKYLLHCTCGLRLIASCYYARDLAEDPEEAIFGLNARLIHDPCCLDWFEDTQPSYPSWDTNPPSLLTGEGAGPAKSDTPNISSLSLGMTTAGSDVKIFVAPPAMQTGMYAAL